MIDHIQTCQFWDRIRQLSGLQLACMYCKYMYLSRIWKHGHRDQINICTFMLYSILNCSLSLILSSPFCDLLHRRCPTIFCNQWHCCINDIRHKSIHFYRRTISYSPLQFHPTHGSLILAIGFGKGFRSIRHHTKFMSNVYCNTLQWRHSERDGVWNNRRLDGLLKRLIRHRSKKTSKLCITGLCEGNSPVTGKFPWQTDSNAENVSIWWCHHDELFVTWNTIPSARDHLNMILYDRYIFSKGNELICNTFIKHKAFEHIGMSVHQYVHHIIAMVQGDLHNSMYTFTYIYHIYFYEIFIFIYGYFNLYLYILYIFYMVILIFTS